MTIEQRTMVGVDGTECTFSVSSSGTHEFPGGYLVDDVTMHWFVETGLLREKGPSALLVANALTGNVDTPDLAAHSVSVQVIASRISQQFPRLAVEIVKTLSPSTGGTP